MAAQLVDSSTRDLVPGTNWRRSSRCDINGSCVEIAALRDGQVGIRDGKIGAASPVLAFSPETFRDFVSAVAAGQFDDAS
jgi:hypothetical protein